MEAVLGTLWLPCLICMVAGITLMTLELCLPGFGAAGVAGFFCCGAVIVMQYLTNDAGTASIIAFIMLLLMLVLFLLFLRAMRKGWLFRSPIVLRDNIEEKSLSFQKEDKQDLLGKTGIAETALRPSGTAVIEGKRYSVRTDAGFIEKGSNIRVVSLDGLSIVVE